MQALSRQLQKPFICDLIHNATIKIASMNNFTVANAKINSKPLLFQSYTKQIINNNFLRNRYIKKSTDFKSINTNESKVISNIRQYSNDSNKIRRYSLENGVITKNNNTYKDDCLEIATIIYKHNIKISTPKSNESEKSASSIMVGKLTNGSCFFVEYYSKDNNEQELGSMTVASDWESLFNDVKDNNLYELVKPLDENIQKEKEYPIINKFNSKTIRDLLKTNFTFTNVFTGEIRKISGE